MENVDAHFSPAPASLFSTFQFSNEVSLFDGRIRVDIAECNLSNAAEMHRSALHKESSRPWLLHTIHFILADGDFLLKVSGFIVLAISSPPPGCFRTRLAHNRCSTGIAQRKAREGQAITLSSARFISFRTIGFNQVLEHLHGQSSTHFLHSLFVLPFLFLSLPRLLTTA
jgi:hypothetical protein